MIGPSRSSALALAFAVWFLSAAALVAADDQDKRVRLEVQVTSEKTGKPIGNATVYIKFKRKRLLRRDKRHEWTVKTNREGKAVLPVLPAGEVLVQIVMPGWKTYGRFHTLRGPKQILEIKLKKPKKWY